MTYVEQQTSAELRAHMRSLKKMHGWHNPLDDRLFREIEAQDAEIARLQELLRGVGANRYWEGRWRDAEAENARLRAALKPFAEAAHKAGISGQPVFVFVDASDYERAASAVDHEQGATDGGN